MLTGKQVSTLLTFYPVCCWCGPRLEITASHPRVLHYVPAASQSSSAGLLMCLRARWPEKQYRSPSAHFYTMGFNGVEHLAFICECSTEFPSRCFLTFEAFDIIESILRPCSSLRYGGSASGLPKAVGRAVSLISVEIQSMHEGIVRGKL